MTYNHVDSPYTRNNAQRQDNNNVSWCQQYTDLTMRQSCGFAHQHFVHRTCQYISSSRAYDTVYEYHWDTEDTSLSLKGEHRQKPTISSLQP